MSKWEEILEYIKQGPNRTRKLNEIESKFKDWDQTEFVKAHGELVNQIPPAVVIKRKYLRDEIEYTATNVYSLD